MNARTKIDSHGHIKIPVELRTRYGLQSKSLADIRGIEDGLLVKKTEYMEDIAGVIEDIPPTGRETTSGVQLEMPSNSDWMVEYAKETDTLSLGPDLVVERAAEKLRWVLYPMLTYLNELDEAATPTASLPILEDITRLSYTGEITVDREFRYRYGLHPNAEVEISDTGEGLLIRKVADSEDPVDRVTGILPPGNLLGQSGGSDADMRWFRGG